MASSAGDVAVGAGGDQHAGAMRLRGQARGEVDACNAAGLRRGSAARSPSTDRRARWRRACAALRASSRTGPPSPDCRPARTAPDRPGSAPDRLRAAGQRLIGADSRCARRRRRRRRAPRPAWSGRPRRAPRPEPLAVRLGGDRRDQVGRQVGVDLDRGGAGAARPRDRRAAGRCRRRSPASRAPGRGAKPALTAAVRGSAKKLGPGDQGGVIDVRRRQSRRRARRGRARRPRADRRP